MIVANFTHIVQALRELSADTPPMRRNARGKVPPPLKGQDHLHIG